MNLYVLVLWNCMGAITVWAQAGLPCLTGEMQDLQSWVDNEGRLKPQTATFVDVSESTKPVSALQSELNRRAKSRKQIKVLSMARCRLREVPDVFSFKDANNNSLADTIEYLTLYGNKFDDHQSTGDNYDSFINATNARTLVSGMGYDTRVMASWPGGFKNVHFKYLRELDLRACSIATLSGGIFEGMETLEALYLSANSILFINAKAFAGLRNLAHLDLSRNYDFDEFGNHKNLALESADVMADLENLVSLDFSFTRLTQNNLMIFNHLGKKFQRLSLCETGLTMLRNNIFSNTSLKYLDISGNNGILSRNAIAGLENTLEVLYAAKVGLTNFDIFEGFKRLEILNVRQNEIPSLTNAVLKTFKYLQILDLDHNRLTTWLEPRFILMPRLRYLSLRKNNINMINENMIEDFKNLEYLGFADNLVICNCHARDLFETAVLADKNPGREAILATTYNNVNTSKYASFHTGFRRYNDIISKRTNVTESCVMDENCDASVDGANSTGAFRLFDYDPLAYQCMPLGEGQIIPYSKSVSCNAVPRADYQEAINDSWNKLIALSIIPAILFPILIFVYIFRRNFKYFCITVKNSALLSMINNDTAIDDSRIFNYDVFVSYCNDDRGWILDQLLPHLETDCGVSVCLHERDFQVGLSILENIVSCMDRSRSIMLIISKEFLLSQWCQFEMHLAQHRLLETRREDLILVLLEEIPRHLRPTTLHYLMLTKTYIVYPSDGGDSGKKEFWKRLARSVTARRPEHENDSLA